MVYSTYSWWNWGWFMIDLRSGFDRYLKMTIFLPGFVVTWEQRFFSSPRGNMADGCGMSWWPFINFTLHSLSMIVMIVILIYFNIFQLQYASIFHCPRYTKKSKEYGPSMSNYGSHCDFTTSTSQTWAFPCVLQSPGPQCQQCPLVALHSESLSKSACYTTHTMARESAVISLLTRVNQKSAQNT